MKPRSFSRVAIFALALIILSAAPHALAAPFKNPPSAVDDFYNASEDFPLNIPAPGVLANDSDVEGKSLTALLVLPPNHGSLTLNSNGSFIYTSEPNFNGLDGFVYKANNGSDDSNPAIVTILVAPVNDDPEANDDACTTAEDTPIDIPILGNDFDVDGNLDPASVTLVSLPPNGSATVEESGGNIIYIPSSNFNGEDRFLYQVCDTQNLCDLAFVRVAVTSINDSPVSTADHYDTSLDDGVSVSAPGVLQNDSDVENSPLTVILENGPTHAALFDLYASGAFSYVPQTGFIGSDSFTYQAFDGELSSEIVRVEITVFDDLPPQASWIAPVENGAVYDVEDGSTVTLEVTAADNVGVAQVHFFWWDAARLKLVDLGYVRQSPYRLELDTDLLNPEWNQIFASAYDERGNESDTLWIWLYKLETPEYKVFVPLTVR